VGLPPPVAGPVPGSAGRFRPRPGWAGRATRPVHAGQLPDLKAGAIVPPVYLTSAAEEALAARPMSGRGGTMATSLHGGCAAVDRFPGALQIAQVALSLDGVESLASLPRETFHRGRSDAELAARAIDDGPVRLSLGIEEPEDLVRGIREALASTRSGATPPL
jgi:Cys/Met metabolism PLP-dependent enzyme